MMHFIRKVANLQHFRNFFQISGHVILHSFALQGQYTKEDDTASVHKTIFFQAIRATYTDEIFTISIYGRKLYKVEYLLFYDQAGLA